MSGRSISFTSTSCGIRSSGSWSRPCPRGTRRRRGASASCEVRRRRCARPPARHRCMSRWWGCAGLPIHGERGESVASARYSGRRHQMIITQVNGDIVARACHRCIKLSFFEHRCLRGVRASHSRRRSGGRHSEMAERRPVVDLWSMNQVSHDARSLSKGLHAPPSRRRAMCPM